MQSPPREKTISEFLSQFFSLLNEEDISYCVLRNYETLPSETGNDIDIWVKDGEQQRFQALLLETTKNIRLGHHKIFTEIYLPGRRRLFPYKIESRIYCYTY